MTHTCHHCGAPLALGAIACFRCGRMVEAEGSGGTTGSGAMPTELQTVAKAGLLEGQWRLVRPIGQGNSGVVWEAQDVALDRRVAVKLMHEALASDPRQVTRFEREAKVLATLDHPNLTPVLGSGRFLGRPFVVMRLLSGRTVAELMHASGGKLRIAEVSFCVLPVCDALQALHDASVVHRDLKPSNVFIGEDGRVTLLDLGQAFETGSELTRTGEVAGTVEYLSPEQLAGRGVDARSDVYALGCLMHELFTGRPPFVGDLAQVLVAHASAPRPALPQLPHGSGALVRRMLSVDPAARPSLAEVRALLQPHAPPRVELPEVAVRAPAPVERPRTRSAHSAPSLPPVVDRERDTTPQRPPRPSRQPPPSRPPPPSRQEAPTGPMNPVSWLVAPAAPAALEGEVPLEEGATALGRTVRAREVVTKPIERPLSRSALAVMAIAAVSLVGFVMVGITQQPAPVPAPVRVDEPRIEMQVKLDPPPATPPPPGPPPEIMTPPPLPPLPALAEKKEQANAAPPVAAPPKRGRAPNRAPVDKGYLRIITTMEGDEIDCRLSIDGEYVGHTPYLSGVLRPGEHVMKAECPDWPPEVVIWPIPPVAMQKLGELVEILVGTGAQADQPIQGVREQAGYSRPCPKGAPGCR